MSTCAYTQTHAHTGTQSSKIFNIPGLGFTTTNMIIYSEFYLWMEIENLSFTFLSMNNSKRNSHIYILVLTLKFSLSNNYFINKPIILGNMSTIYDLR